MSESLPPNEDLGSFDGTLDYAQARLNPIQLSGLLNGFQGTIAVDYSKGLVNFYGASVLGQTGQVELLTIDFETLNGNPSTLYLDFSAMASQSTFEDLIPVLEVNNLSVDPVNQDVLLGDVNADNATNSTDALIILSYDAGLDVGDHLNRINGGVGDVNFVEPTNSTDALLVLSNEVSMTPDPDIGYKFCF
jgi:hypothetical protein